MDYLKWEEDAIYLYYLLKDTKDGVVWESYYKTHDGFQIKDTNIVFKNEIDAKRYCEINAKAKIEEQIEYLKSLLVD